MTNLDDLLRKADQALIEKRVPEAISLCQQAASIDPKSKRANLKLAAILRQTGRTPDAISVLETFIKVSEQVAAAQGLLAHCYMEQRRYSEAIASFQKAQALDSSEPRYQTDLAAAHSAQGMAYQESGRFEEAINSFKQAISLAPARRRLYLNIVVSQKIAPGNPVLKQIGDLLESRDLPYPDRRSLLYAMAKASDDLGEYENALRYADAATQITIDHPNPNVSHFDPEQDRAKVDFAISAFSKQFLEDHQGLGLDLELPVFIVGSPRSGTTLLDQILCSHPQIGSAGEQPFWTENIGVALNAIRNGSKEVAEMAEQYLQILRSHSPKKKRVVDKMPTNYGAAGLVHMLFPNARIVHVRRNPVDTCLSLYLNAHSMRAVPFGHTRENIVEGYKNYLRVMDHWRGILPADRFMEIDYEQLVADREGITRRIVEFLGLGWNNACLQHEKNTRAVSTPSFWQVRQPVYNTSVERWRNYEPWLGAFRNLLTESDPF